MERSKLSLKWLEVFQAVARHGSVRAASAELGVSVSTVSHHLACLEQALDARLIDHNKRPMSLTPEGDAFLRRVDEALWLLRKGVAEVWSGNLTSLARVLRIAHVEDFDTDVAPTLVDRLSRAMPAAEFSMLSRPSHEIFDLLQSEQVDIGIASLTEHGISGLAEKPVLRDPFLLVTPTTLKKPPTDSGQLLSLGADLPLLRYSRQQLIGRQIEAQLHRLEIRLPWRMAFESTHAILSMVAAGRGWTITTALNYARAQRYHDGIRLTPFPGKAFSRQISVFQRDDLPNGIHDMLATILRGAVQRLIVEPTVARHPWLTGTFCQLPEKAELAPRTDSDRM
ncbi:MAG: LysR family transcriptional regulator [Pseudomonadota bacterium]